MRRFDEREVDALVQLSPRLCAAIGACWRMNTLPPDEIPSVSPPVPLAVAVNDDCFTVTSAVELPTPPEKRIP